ncbi:hypothetical protein INR49_011984, partial [Caranx melampygus]
MVNQRLYWWTLRCTRSSIDVNGGTRHSLIYNEEKLAHPISLTKEITELAKDLDQPEDIIVYHNLKQNNGTDTLSDRG